LPLEIQEFSKTFFKEIPIFADKISLSNEQRKIVGFLFKFPAQITSFVKKIPLSISYLQFRIKRIPKKINFDICINFATADDFKAVFTDADYFKEQEKLAEKQAEENIKKLNAFFDKNIK